MKRIVSTCAVILLLISPALAAAKGKGPVYVPPNQSAASQYTEDVPTAGGNTPTDRVHHPAGGSGSGGSHGGGSGGAGAAGSSGAGGAGGASIPSSTLKAMSKAGSAGTAAASLAQALVPSVKRSFAKTAHPSSTAGQIVKTLAGSDAGSGIGAALPITLVATLVLATGFGLLRLRGPGPIA